MTTNENDMSGVDAVINSLGAFSPENIETTLSSFQDSAWSQYNEALSQHDYHKANALKQIARNFDNPELQNQLRSSWDNILQPLQDSYNNATDNLGKLNSLGDALTKLGETSLIGEAALAGLNLGEAVNSDNHTEAGKALLSPLLGGLLAGLLIPSGIGLGGAIGLGLLAGLFVDTAYDFLPEEWREGIGEFLDDLLQPLIDDLADLLEEWDPLGIMPDVNEDFNNTLNWIQRADPLTLDLDGDGIETLGANGSVVFDHNGDGIKTGTGWVAPDDGLLVLDKNGNGLIDNGNELFGDNTVKADGSLARNGFDALADLDSNADGRIDNNDERFADLRVWQDANSDGVSQSSELLTLAEAGVAGINLANEETVQNVGNDNVTNAVGTFERTDGTEGDVQAAVASLDLAANPFYREFTDTVEIPEALLDLPDMQGSGAVRDLWEAA